MDNLRYADDAVLTAENETELQRLSDTNKNGCLDRKQIHENKNNCGEKKKNITRIKKKIRKSWGHTGASKKLQYLGQL